MAMVARESGFLADFASVPWRRFSAALTRELSAGPNAIVRRLDGDLDVMRVRLAQARAADADEPRLGAKIFDRRRADVLHTGTQPADELIDERLERTDRSHL